MYIGRPYYDLIIAWSYYVYTASLTDTVIFLLNPVFFFKQIEYCYRGFHT